MNCPFCGDTDFDRIGLYLHISQDRCPEIENIQKDYVLEISRYNQTAGDGNPHLTTTEKEPK